MNALTPPYSTAVAIYFLSQIFYAEFAHACRALTAGSFYLTKRERELKHVGTCGVRAFEESSGGPNARRCGGVCRKKERALRRLASPGALINAKDCAREEFAWPLAGSQLFDNFRGRLAHYALISIVLRLDGRIVYRFTLARIFIRGRRRLRV
jgi:hypothetical protein